MKLSKIKRLDLISNAPRSNKKKYIKSDNSGNNSNDKQPYHFNDSDLGEFARWLENCPLVENSGEVDVDRAYLDKGITIKNQTLLSYDLQMSENGYDCKFLFNDNEIQTTLSIETDTDSDEGGSRVVIGEVLNKTFNYTTPICINRYFEQDEEFNTSEHYEVRIFNPDDKTLGDKIDITNQEIENAIIDNRLYCVRYPDPDDPDAESHIIDFYNVNNFTRYGNVIFIEWILHGLGCSTYYTNTIGLKIYDGIIEEINSTNS